MEDKNINNKIEDRVLDAIRRGEVAMKPRWHFVWNGILRGLILILALFFAVYMLSFIGLVFHERHLLAILDMTPHGMIAFMEAMPWVLLGVSALLCVALYITIRHYTFVYKMPRVYTLVSIAVAVVAFVSIIHAFDDDFKFPRYGENSRSIFFMPMHSHYRGEMYLHMFYQNRGAMGRPIFTPYFSNPKKF